MSSSFSFGAPASTGGSTGQSLFGTTNKPAATGGSLFGNTGAAAGSGSSGGFSFGAPSQPSSAENKAATPSLFGNPGAAGTTGSSSGFSFGQPKPEEKKSGDAPKSLFSGFGTPDKSSTPATSAPSLFGSTTPATTSGSAQFSFGNPSTTPAGPPPSTNAFGASTGGGGLFAPKQTQDASQTSGFSFGKPPATTAPAAGTTSTSGGLFGAAPTGAPSTGGGFSFGGAPKPAETAPSNTTLVPATSAPQPKPTFSFGAPASSTSSATAAPASAATQATASTPLFGAQQPAQTASNMFSKPATTDLGGAGKPSPFAAPATQAAGSAAPAPAQKSLFGGFNLGGSSSTASAPTPATTTATTTSSAPTSSAPSASPFSFPTASTASASQPTTAPAPASGGFSFGPKPTAPTSQPATSSSVPGGLFSLGQSTSTSTSQPAASAGASASGIGQSAPGLPSGTIGAQTSTAGPTPPAQSRLRNKTMDEILTRWATDMSRYSKEFKDHAETIARWDQLIVDNSSKIDKLYVRTRTCERQTMSVDMQLSAIENQQAELESWLSKYENDVDEILAKDSANPSEMGGPDQERERTYKLAEKLGERLEEMDRDLASMVEEVNAANTSLSKHGKADEPITQIVKILNSHLIQLQAIDQGTIALQEKVAAAQKSASNLSYLNGSTNGNGGAAVQDFYRSYMGRR